MRENDVAREIVDSAYRIHSRIGPGLLESVYQALLVHELERRGLRVRCEVPVPIRYEGLEIDLAFRADMLVEELVLVELKALEQEAPVHRRQLLTYLRLTDLRLGLLINFGAPLIKDGITRLANRLPN